MPNPTTNTYDKLTQVTASSGGINIAQQDRDAISKAIMDRFLAKGGINGGVTKLTPEMKASLDKLKNSGELDELSKSFLSEGSSSNGSLESAKNTLSGINNLSADGITSVAQQMVNSDLVQSQLSQLQQQTKAGLQDALGMLDDNSARTNSMGSSRAALAKGIATGKAQEALTQGSQAIIGNATENALARSERIQGANISNDFNKANGFMNLNDAGLRTKSAGVNASQQAISNLLKAGGITQEQAERMIQSGDMNLEGLIRQLGGLNGVTEDRNIGEKGKTVTSGGGLTTREQLTGAGLALGGSLIEAGLKKYFSLN